ncbi:outer membrane protein assembly factor BamB family protein [Faunimonas sp. B44]|uniref:outer membrane protein assembly factor BamB family protein n=1 Tax=Faunimonas sp. B44 TaxID=3461493 RepID=UPI0040445392
MTATHTARRSGATTILILAAGLLAGCGSLDFLGSKETPLPGERRPALASLGVEAAGGRAHPGPQTASADWSQPGGNAANAPGNVSLASGGANAAWRATATAALAKRNARSPAPPIVHGGRIYVYGSDGAVTSLSAGGGRAWSVSLAPEGDRASLPGGGVAAAGNAVFAATGYGELVALDASTGGRVWTYKLDAPARSAPTAAGGKVYVVSATSTVHAVNAADGTLAWTQSGIRETAGVLSAASPAVSGNTVVVPLPSGEIIALDTATGQPKWGDTVVRATRSMAVAGLTDLAASPVIHDGVVYATGVAGRTIAIRLANGERLWEQNVGSATTPAVAGDAVFLVDLADNMVALDRRTGRVAWRTALPAVREKRFFSVWVGPTLAGGALWAVSNDGKLVSVDPTNGTIVGTRPLSSPSFVRPVAASGQLLVLGSDGQLSAFQ